MQTNEGAIKMYAANKHNKHKQGVLIYVFSTICFLQGYIYLHLFLRHKHGSYAQTDII